MKNRGDETGERARYSLPCSLMFAFPHDLNADFLSAHMFSHLTIPWAESGKKDCS